MQKRVIIIGAGVGGLATACLLAKAGHKVTVYDKNEQPGGRNSIFKAKGFTFNYGPSWYLMPDVFEHFFKLMDENISDHLTLERLAPSYRVFFKDTLFGAVDIYGDRARDGRTFESFEPGAKVKLNAYLNRAEQLYDLAKEEVLYQNSNSWRDLLSPRTVSIAMKLNLLSNMHKYIAGQFKSHELQKILEYPAAFLGTSPYKAPVFYHILNHVDFNQGVFYPKGGMYSITTALMALAKKHSVKVHCKTEVIRIAADNGTTNGVVLASGKHVKADLVISNAGLHHTEQKLVPPSLRMYSDRYLKSRTLAPSSLMIHLGVSGQLPQLEHHNLLFSKKWKAHLDSLFQEKVWLGDPSMYICNPSKTDPSVARKGHENLTVLVPLASGLTYTDERLATYADHILQTLEEAIHLDNFRSRIVYKRLFCVRDFAERYNAPEGTALGLAHTLRQTAIFRPSNTYKKIQNLYFVGADTTPGIGLPMCLISAELVYKRLIDSL